MKGRVFLVEDRDSLRRLMVRALEQVVRGARLFNRPVGICGEQGGHPESIRFCHHIGLSYVSCSPHRVPIARIAAAQAKITEDEYIVEQGMTLENKSL